MNRRTINFIRFILEELLPPILRDSILFKYLVKYTYRNDHTHETLRENILNISKSSEIYTEMRYGAGGVSVPHRIDWAQTFFLLILF